MNIIRLLRQRYKMHLIYTLPRHVCLLSKVYISGLTVLFAGVNVTSYTSPTLCQEFRM